MNTLAWTLGFSLWSAVALAQEAVDLGQKVPAPPNRPQETQASGISSEDYSPKTPETLAYVASYLRQGIQVLLDPEDKDAKARSVKEFPYWATQLLEDSGDLQRQHLQQAFVIPFINRLSQTYRQQISYVPGKTLQVTWERGWLRKELVQVYARLEGLAKNVAGAKEGKEFYATFKIYDYNFRNIYAFTSDFLVAFNEHLNHQPLTRAEYEHWSSMLGLVSTTIEALYDLSFLVYANLERHGVELDFDRSSITCWYSTNSDYRISDGKAYAPIGSYVLNAEGLATSYQHPEGVERKTLDSDRSIGLQAYQQWAENLKAASKSGGPQDLYPESPQPVDLYPSSRSPQQKPEGLPVPQAEGKASGLPEGVGR